MATKEKGRDRLATGATPQEKKHRRPDSTETDPLEGWLSLARQAAATQRKLGVRPVRGRARRLRCTNFKPLRRGSLLGFADLELDSGLVILECTLHEANGKRWTNPPGRPMLDADKRPIVKGGKVQYAPVIEFKDRQARYRWSDAAVKAIEALESTKPAGGGLHEDGKHRSTRHGY